jgi:hypothetical protein
MNKNEKTLQASKKKGIDEKKHSTNTEHKRTLT